MNNHHRAHYAVEALLAIVATIAIWTGMRGFSAAVHQKHVAASHQWSALGAPARAAMADVLKSDTKRSVRIACASDCASLPADLGAVFDAIGWLHATAAVFGTPTGIVVSPDDADGRRIAAALKAASPEIGAALTIVTVDEAGPLVIIGHKQR